MIVFGCALMLSTRAIWYSYGRKGATVPPVRIQVRSANEGQQSTPGSAVKPVVVWYLFDRARR